METTRIALLGLGDMGTAFARAWLAAGYPLTVWNRTAARAEPLAAAGAEVAATPAEAVAAADLVVLCLLDDASVGAVLEDAGLTGKDVVNLTTGTPAEGRARAAWAAARGARFLDAGIMAVPPMIGVPDSGAYVFYSGDRALFDAHRAALAVPAGAVYAGENAGHAALQDVALLSAMTGMFAGVSHAFALIRKEIAPKEFAPLLVGWLTAMAPYAHGMADHLESGDYTEGVTSNLAMMVKGNATLLNTAAEQGVSPELLTPFMDLMERRVADGHRDEDLTGVVGLLAR
ncbi:NAD(P)-dependent oxidoreductase [Actinomadura macrotermitis]|uniref:2-hydroxy-3-oxopropionate reductase n=1 Tax=Actinomadura macrotermitis TaxID=2585200 RepID=A0A7K0C4Q7_9ACTN|nr:NAD(P)-binding domain-containing protein [Actinomadura macrotermitis]MQY08431.1 2-hydroxy-3-oxopropionate reductase [Actinomadura macrotermitis]